MKNSFQGILASMWISVAVANYYNFVPMYIDDDNIKRKAIFKTFTVCLMTCLSDKECDYAGFLHDPDWMCSKHCLLVKGPSAENRHRNLVYLMADEKWMKDEDISISATITNVEPTEEAKTKGEAPTTTPPPAPLAPPTSRPTAVTTVPTTARETTKIRTPITTTTTSPPPKTTKATTTKTEETEQKITTTTTATTTAETTISEATSTAASTTVKTLPPTAVETTATQAGICPLKNVDYYGHDVRIVGNVESWELCRRLCQESNVCFAWTYLTEVFHDEKKRQNCYFKKQTYKEGKKTLVHMISASKTCRGIYPLKNVDYHGHDARMVGNVVSWEVCRRLCQESNVCFAWTYIAKDFHIENVRKACYFKKQTYNEGKKTYVTMISGSKWC